MSRRRVLPRLLVLATVAAAALWGRINREHFDPETLRAGLEALGLWAPAAYLGLYVVGAVAFLPVSFFWLLGGAL